MSNSQNRIRLKCDLADQYAKPKNLLTLRTPVFPVSKACRVDIGIFDNGIFQSSVAQFDSVTFELMAYATRTGARLVSKTVSAASFNVVSENEWDDIGSQHATFEMTSIEMSVFTVANFEQALWLAITALAGAEPVTLLAGAATAIEDGGVYSGASAPAAGDPAYLTGAQTIAAIAARSSQKYFEANGYSCTWDIVDGELVSHIKLL